MLWINRRFSSRENTVAPLTMPIAAAIRCSTCTSPSLACRLSSTAEAGGGMLLHFTQCTSEDDLPAPHLGQPCLLQWPPSPSPRLPHVPRGVTKPQMLIAIFLNNVIKLFPLLSVTHLSTAAPMRPYGSLPSSYSLLLRLLSKLHITS